MKAFSQIAIVFCVATSACAGLSTRARDQSVAVTIIDESGVRSHEMSVDEGGALTFVNADRTPHQIYSPECPELDSLLLQPGQTHRAVFGAGPKVCHFEDLLAPYLGAYAGTVEVRRSTPDPIFADEA
jgi:hypothetical protein